MFESMIPSAEKLTEMNKQMMTSFGQIGEIAAETQSKLAGQHLAAVEANLGAASKVWDAMIDGKKPAELMALHVETTQALGEQLMGVARETWEVQIEARDKLVGLWRDSAKSATAPARTAPKKASA